MLMLSFLRLLELKMAMREVLRLLLRVTSCGGRRGGDEGGSRAGKVKVLEGGGGGSRG